jgi:hypothetical protein
MNKYMDNVKKHCTPEKIQTIKVGLEQTLEILRQVDTGNTKILGTQLRNIYNSMDKLCLMVLGDTIDFHIERISAFMSKGRIGVTVRDAKDIVIPLIEDLLPRLDDIAANLNSEPSDDEEDEDEAEVSTMLFPRNKYLNLSNANQFPDVKSKYRELSLVYHPDKCPNDKTPGFSKQKCEDEFKVLNNEYNAIKEKLGVSGGKRRSRKSKTKKNKTRKNKTRKGKNSRRRSKKNTRRYRR